MPEDWETGGFGLYIHWPFCRAKCPYCDFNSHVSQSIDQSRWATAYLSEIDRIGKLTSGRILKSVFFGGGTPSLMDPDVVAAILERVRSTWRLANDLEVTLEANPTSVEAGRFVAYRDGGVNRVSVGLQALNDRDLKMLGRQHSAAEGLAALEMARNTFDRVSFDLIYARQDQSLDDWRDELTRALSFDPDHLSLYQLTIEDGTAFGDRYAVGKLRGLPTEDTAADMYDLTQSLCEDAGLPAYEVSNHAKPGTESTHNLIYWNYGDYAGIGPGAHGRLTLNGSRFETQTEYMPNAWLDLVDQNGSGEVLREPLDAQAQMTEMFLMGLRITEGVDLARVPAEFEPTVSNKINSLQKHGLLDVEFGRVKITAKGRPLLNAVLQELLRD